MANRDYPLAPTTFNDGGDGKSKPSAPKKAANKRPLSEQEMQVVARSQSNLAKVKELKSKGVSPSTLKPFIQKAEASRDSVNTIMQNAWSSPKKKNK